MAVVSLRRPCHIQIARAQSGYPRTSLWKIEQYYQDGNVATWEAQTRSYRKRVWAGPSVPRKLGVPRRWQPPSVWWRSVSQLH